MMATAKKTPQPKRARKRDGKAEFDAAKLMLAAAESKLRRAQQHEARALVMRRSPDAMDVLRGRVRSQSAERGVLRVGARVTSDDAIQQALLIQRLAKEAVVVDRSRSGRDAALKNDKRNKPRTELMREICAFLEIPENAGFISREPMRRWFPDALAAFEAFRGASAGCNVETLRTYFGRARRRILRARAKFLGH